MSKKTSICARLPPKKARAILALLEAPSFRQAAKRAGIDSSTLTRWMKQATFRQAFAEARREAFAVGCARIQYLTAAAGKTIEDILSDENLPPTIRLKAAEVLLTTVLRVVSVVDLEARIQALEEKEGPWTR